VRPVRRALAGVLALLLGAAAGGDEAERPRARDLGLAPGVFEPGPLNAITDVAGVRVGHATLREGDRIRTGVTAVLPHGGNLFQEKVAGAVFVGNAFGKLAGATQVEELGTIETPIVLTNTLAVGTAVTAVVEDTLARPGNEGVRSVNALVGETNDGGLGGHRLGVLVQTNFDGVLAADGVPLGRELGRAALEATEEAVLNSLFRATTVTGSGRTVEAIPLDRVRELLGRHGRGR